MIRAIDHIVILVTDLDAAIADYRALGFTVVPGGEHTDGNTHNALIAFADDSYLELIAFKREAPDHRWSRHIALGEGIVDFALLPDAIEADLAIARSQGLDIEGPFPGGRLRLDGQRIEWQLGSPTTPDMPFLCADVTPRALRVPDGEAQQHANRATGIAELVVAVQDAAESALRYRALLDRSPDQAVQAQLASTNARAFAVGTALIILEGPDAEAGQNELVAKRLATRGEGACALRLRIQNGIEPVPFDVARLHGAQLSWAV